MLTGVPDVLFAWHDEIGDRVGVMPSLLFPCENGVAVMWGRPCFEDGSDWPDPDALRADVEAGRVQALGEIATQFLGLGPSDPAMEPYFALAEEYDLPVFIHMGPGYPAGAYEETRADLRTPNYRAAAGNPLLSCATTRRGSSGSTRRCAADPPHAPTRHERVAIPTAPLHASGCVIRPTPKLARDAVDVARVPAVGPGRAAPPPGRS